MMDATLMRLRASAIEMQQRAMLQKYECEVQLYAAKVKMAQITGIHGARMGKPAPSKCSSCGSREWRYIQTHRICAYCRGEQSP